MSTYLDGNAFTDFLAKFDPTSSKIGGTLVKGVLAAAGTLVGVPPTLTYGAFTGVGKVTGSVKSSQKAAKKPPIDISVSKDQTSVSRNPYERGSALSRGASPSPIGQNTNSTPLIIVAGAGVAILAIMLLMKK
jgi:hypothetical protein